MFCAGTMIISAYNYAFVFCGGTMIISAYTSVLKTGRNSRDGLSWSNFSISFRWAFKTHSIKLQSLIHSHLRLDHSESVRKQITALYNIYILNDEKPNL